MKRTLAVILVAFGAAAPQGQTPPPTYDVIVRNGLVFDGSGQAPYKADVAVLHGFIAKVGNLAGAHAAREIDAANLSVAPGFINIHSHAAPSVLPRAENMLTQGVTTEILNPDGGGNVDIARQLESDAAGGLALNIGAYIGFNSVWAKVVGAADRRPGADDIASMQQLVLAGLEHGAWGVSAGLDYKPAYFAKTDEVVRVLEPAAKWRTNFPNHERLTPESHFSSHAGIAETIAIGEQAGLVPVVTHMKAQGVEQGTAATLTAMMQAATDRGHYTAADVYPYLAGQTGLGALIIPAWAQDGGREKMLARFKDPALRARIVREAEAAMTARFGGPAGVYLPETKRELTDVMKEMHVSAGEAVVRLLEQSNAGAILRFGSEADLVKLLQYPATAIACDCGATTETRTHPRMYGTFPRVLGHYVRETHTLTWEDAIRKMTGLPANTIGLVDRGFLQPGMAADITVFDPATIVDHSTYEEPARLSEGVRYVLVNGTVALSEGKVTGTQGGHVLLRSPHMPSRPMSTTLFRRVVETTQVNGTEVTLRLTQNAAAHHASGTVTLGSGEQAFDATELGTIQAVGNWSSFTGTVTRRDTGEQHAVLGIVERADPFAPGRTLTVTLYLDGKPYPAAVK